MSETRLKKYCLALDLKDDPKIIDSYKTYHQNVWPEINKSIKDCGIKEAEISNHDCVILDDGFQDYKIRKNLNIICFKSKIRQIKYLKYLLTLIGFFLKLIKFTLLLISFL